MQSITAPQVRNAEYYSTLKFEMQSISNCERPEALRALAAS